MVRVGRICAELLGTFILAEGICISGGNASVVWAILWGAIISTGLVSGAQFNPAITTALLLVRVADKSLTRSELVEHGIYYCAHFIGAFLGALVSWAIRKDTFEMMVGARTGQGEAFIAEVFYTSVLILVTLSGGEMQENNWFATLAVAISVYTAGRTIGSISGACLNPAIGLGINAADAIHNGVARAKYLWIYVLGPLTASIVASAIFFLVVRPEIMRHRRRPYIAGQLLAKRRSIQFE